MADAVEVAVGAADEHLEPPIDVRERGRVIDRATERRPAGIAAAGRHLDVVPQGAVSAAGEDLEAPVGVDRRSHAALDDVAERRPVGPTAVGLFAGVDAAIGAAGKHHQQAAQPGSGARVLKPAAGDAADGDPT